MASVAPRMASPGTAPRFFVKQDTSVKKQRKRKAGKPKKRTTVPKEEFPAKVEALPPQATPKSAEETLRLRHHRVRIIVYGDGFSEIEPSDLSFVE